MDIPTISPKAWAISKSRYERIIDKNWRYKQFFNYLQISPSYRLAHLIAKGKIDRNTLSLPEDFELVEATYSDFGNVWRTIFWDWWVKTAQYQFNLSIPPAPTMLMSLNRGQNFNGTVIARTQRALENCLSIDRMAQGNPATAVLSIPIHSDRDSILKEVSSILDRLYKHASETKTFANYTLESNKIRKATTDHARDVVLAHAARPKDPLFVIGNLTKVSPTNVTDPRVKRSEVSDARRLMEIMTSRHIHRAHVLAENAARGKFPSLEPLAEYDKIPKFDFFKLQRQFISYGNWLKSERDKIKVRIENKRKYNFDISQDV